MSLSSLRMALTSRCDFTLTIWYGAGVYCRAMVEYTGFDSMTITGLEVNSARAHSPGAGAVWLPFVRIVRIGG